MSRRERERVHDRDRDRVRDRDRDRDRGRDTRYSDSRRRRPGFNREPSPKRSRRDGKPETGQMPSYTNMNVRDNTDNEQKHHCKLHDALPLETPTAHDTKEESGVLNKESNEKANGNHEGAKLVSDPTQVPRSRSYFQHDERGSAGQSGRSYGHRATKEHGWRDPKDERTERLASQSAAYDSHQRDQKLQDKGSGGVWRHDGFLKMEAEQPPAVRKRPAFSEKKMLRVSEIAVRAADEPARLGHSDEIPSTNDRRDKTDRRPHHLDRYERPAAGGRRESQWKGVSSRERYGVASGHYRGRERFGGPQDYRPSGNQGEKWKHDLYDEGNGIPTTENEEDHIAKVEALLAS